MKTTHLKAVRFAALAAVVAMGLTACGGGGGDTTGSAAPADGSVSAASLAGTYSVTGSAGGMSAAFAVNRNAAVTACTLAGADTCTGVIVPGTQTAGSTFKITATRTGSATSVAELAGSIAAGGTLTGKLTQGGASQDVGGSKVADTFADCVSPLVLDNGSCKAPSAGISLMPTVSWAIEESPSGRTYTMQLCYGSIYQCEAISDPLFVSRADLADADFPGVLAYAESVALQYSQMIAKLWAAKTYPSHAQIIATFRAAVNQALATEMENAVQTASSAFTAAGYPAAGGGTGGTVSATPPSTTLTMIPQPIGYAQIVPTPASHRNNSSDLCTSWQVIGAPVRMSTCSSAEGSSGYTAVENNGSATDVCYVVTSKLGGSPQELCHFAMPVGTVDKASCSKCGTKNGGADIALKKYNGVVY
jgi:hypothetical protein